MTNHENFYLLSPFKGKKRSFAEQSVRMGWRGFPLLTEPRFMSRSVNARCAERETPHPIDQEKSALEFPYLQFP
ncbi:hypothetical protein ACP6PL_16210, partial [Dapis sp. BLCC M126]|uniref:hypothetical protein n=1 Tax=Dapis sp. BLCC M126 TaxID=3400189 RepID=UPI003CF69A5E